MCPNECPGLDEVWGEEFEKLYERYAGWADLWALVVLTPPLYQVTIAVWYLGAKPQKPSPMSCHLESDHFPGI